MTIKQGLYYTQKPSERQEMSHEMFTHGLSLSCKINYSSPASQPIPSPTPSNTPQSVYQMNSDSENTETLMLSTLLTWN